MRGIRLIVGPYQSERTTQISYNRRRKTKKYLNAPDKDITSFFVLIAKLSIILRNFKEKEKPQISSMKALPEPNSLSYDLLFLYLQLCIVNDDDPQFNDFAYTSRYWLRKETDEEL